MPLSRDQFEPDLSAKEISSRGTAEFRPIIALGFITGLLTLGGIAWAQRGTGAWVTTVLSVCLAVVALHRLRRERFLLRNCQTTAATVTDWEKAKSSDGGYSYSVRYRFLGPDGRAYMGKATSQVELPHQGEMLPISY